MPTSTFNNLPKEKQKRIDQALFDEFSHHALPEAQVSRIVKEAKIARGAFYKYFKDLNDAYVYLYRKVMETIHQPLDLSQAKDSAYYLKLVENFLDDVNNQKCWSLVHLHLTTNADLLGNTNYLPKFSYHLTIQQWMIMVLVHQTLVDCLNDPDQKDQLLARLGQALKITLKENE